MAVLGLTLLRGLQVEVKLNSVMCHVTICAHPLLVLVYCCYLFAKLCLTLCEPMGCCLPGSSVYGISQAKVLEWVTMSCSRGSP